MENSFTGLYIHIPFCKSKCSYCDFNSFQAMEEYIEDYCMALLKELGNFALEEKGRVINSVFIGGGTPSYISQKYITQIMDFIHENFKLKNNAEISIECNPGTIDIEKLKSYRNSGINRLSIGLQAWQDNLLKLLGRIHDSRDYEISVLLAHEAGFKNINTDLIFGIPGQTLLQWKETMEKTLKSGITHLSCYSLKIEEGTPIRQKVDDKILIPLEDEIDRQMYYDTLALLKKKGFRHYEISNFSKPGYECLHNINYWKCGEYIGVGAGAHSFINYYRFNNTYGIKEYIERINKDKKPSESHCYIDRKERMKEFVILGLRLTEGIDCSAFLELFGERIDEVFYEPLINCSEKGLLLINKKNIKLSAKGLDLANIVFSSFI